MKVLIIDNIDSFVYNLYQYVGEQGIDVLVRRNNITPDKIREINPDKIIISPGPGNPSQAGNCIYIIKEFGMTLPILGVCLGHQAIGQAFGGKVDRSHHLMHGKTSQISHVGKGIFKGIKTPITATRYHSLAVMEEGLPRELEVTARAVDDNIIMALRHREYPICGVQFHPESILTPQGKAILKNFLEGRQ